MTKLRIFGAACVAIALAASPALARGPGGGGGHGGGAHFGGGGGVPHFAGGGMGGARGASMGGARFASGGARFGGGNYRGGGFRRGGFGPGIAAGVIGGLSPLLSGSLYVWAKAAWPIALFLVTASIISVVSILLSANLGAIPKSEATLAPAV